MVYIPLFHQHTHGALENTASAGQLPDGGCVCVYRSPGWRERQHAKYAVTKKVHRWRVEVCSPSLLGHSPGSFYGLFKAVVQTKQRFLSFHHDILKDQTRGWGRWKYTANSAQKRGCCFTVKALMLTLAPHPQAPSWDPSQLKSQVTLEFLCTCRGEGSSRSGFETLSQGTGKDRAGHGGAWTVFPQAQANENASKNASGRGWSFSSQCHLSWGQLSSS